LDSSDDSESSLLSEVGNSPGDSGFNQSQGFGGLDDSGLHLSVGHSHGDDGWLDDSSDLLSLEPSDGEHWGLDNGD